MKFLLTVANEQGAVMDTGRVTVPASFPDRPGIRSGPEFFAAAVLKASWKMRRTDRC